MSSKIEVEWIAQAQGMNATLERINQKLDAQEKKLEQIGKTSQKAANAATGSFAALSKELKTAEDKLKGMAKGTDEFKKQKAEVDKLRQSVAAASGAMNAQAQSVGAKIGGNIAGMMAGFFTIQKVTEAISSELEKAGRLKAEAARATMTLEEAIADLAQNIPASDLPAARKMVEQNAPKLGTTQQGLANLLGIGISAGAKDLPEALSLASAALKLTAGNADKAQPLVGSTLDVASLQGSTNFEGAAGQLLQVQSQVRSTNLPEFGRNIGPGLAAAMLDKEMIKGVSSEVAFENAAVISQIIKDQTGSNTATTMRMFFTRLGSFVPESKQKIDGREVGVDKATIDRFAAASTFEGRLAMMRENKNLADQFLETQRESIGKIAIAAIVQGRDPIVMAMEKKAQDSISGLDDAQIEFRKRVDAIGLQTPVLIAERKAQAAIAEAQTTGVAGQKGEVSKIVADTLANVDLSGSDLLNEQRLKLNFKLYKEQGVPDIEAGQMVLREAMQANFPFPNVSQEHLKLLQNMVDVLEDMKKEMAKRDQQPGKQQNVRPQAAPLPAATVP